MDGVGLAYVSFALCLALCFCPGLLHLFCYVCLFTFVFPFFRALFVFYCYLCFGRLLQFHRIAVYPAPTGLRDRAHV